MLLPYVPAKDKMLSRDSRNAADKGEATAETAANQILDASI
jgi:hypothetical protein